MPVAYLCAIFTDLMCYLPLATAFTMVSERLSISFLVSCFVCPVLAATMSTNSAFERESCAVVWIFLANFALAGANEDPRPTWLIITRKLEAILIYYLFNPTQASA